MGTAGASTQIENPYDRFRMWRDCAVAASTLGRWWATDSAGGCDTVVSRGGASDADAVGWQRYGVGCSVANRVAASRWEPERLRKAAHGDAAAAESMGRASPFAGRRME